MANLTVKGIAPLQEDGDLRLVTDWIDAGLVRNSPSEIEFEMLQSSITGRYIGSQQVAVRAITLPSRQAGTVDASADCS
jgi:hypothetical protein